MRFDKAYRVSKQRTHLLIVPAFALFVVVGVVFWAMVPIDDDPTYSLAIALLVLTTVPFAVALARGTLDLLEPINILSFVIALYFAVRAIYVVSGINPFASRFGYYPYQDTIPLALGHTILGYLLLLAGYYSPIASKIARALPRFVWRWPQSLSFARVLLIYAIGLSAQILLFSFAGSNIWVLGSDSGNLPSYFLVALSVFLQYATGMTSISIFGGGAAKNFVRLFWLVLVPTAIVQSFTLGGRYYLIAVATMVLVAYHYLRRHVSPFQVVVSAVVIFTTLFPALGIYRGMYLRSAGVARSPAELVETVLGLPGYLSQLGWPEYVSLAADALMSRSHGIDSLSLIIKYTPGLSDFKYGREYLLIPAYAFIPRAIWRDKPLNQSAVFAKLYVLDPAVLVGGSIGQFHIGDLYWNFGLPGIVVGMFVLGIFYRSVYVYLSPNESKDPLRVFLYMFFLLLVMLAFEVDIASMASSLLKTLVSLIPVCWFMRETK
jgi:oligosaccharide repeat unit polymerase